MLDAALATVNVKIANDNTAFFMGLDLLDDGGTEVPPHYIYVDGALDVTVQA
jgi:hypothetical protein